ncbi:hypothetical protein [Granulicella arctica]|uniref:Uncharacterized protein n=1 Tax=Granulicella arctica TaxID=940613 RepID=A0A7Y9PGF1_9BACT|nr:hypothetical protein [Granulicella arctica]NYF79432.1 hypothetical protein [Granulicella arctica]
MRKPTRYSWLLMLALVAALGVALLLRAKAPPEVARLLPECDAIVYANVKPLRTATHFDKTVVARSAEFQQFIDATGIVPERDLDAVAFALHRMDDPNGPNGPVAYSEVFEGRFDAEKLAHYLTGVATSTESYAGHEIFTIPVGEVKGPKGRQLRVTQLGYDTIAASNMPTTEQIHAMLDRHRAGASPFAGSSLLADRYGDVPVLSSAWAIGHIGLPFSERGYITLFGLQLPLPEDTTFVASVRYLGSIRLRIEELSPTEADAAEATKALSSVLNVFKTIQQIQTQPKTDAALRQMVDSLKIDQSKDRTVVTANIPMELLRDMATPEKEVPSDSLPASH